MRATLYPTPQRVGFYWAKWKIADPQTADYPNNGLPSSRWEVVDVFENSPNPSSDEYLLVHVSGVAKGQPVENFFWGPGPLEPP